MTAPLANPSNHPFSLKPRPALPPSKTSLSIFAKPTPVRRTGRTARLCAALSRPFVSASVDAANNSSESIIDDLFGPFAPERYMSLPPCSRSATKALIAVAMAKGLDDVSELETARRACAPSETPKKRSSAFAQHNTDSSVLPPQLQERDPWFDEISGLLLGQPVSDAVQAEIDALVILDVPPTIKLPAPYLHIPPETYSLEHVYGLDMTSTCDILPRTVPSRKRSACFSLSQTPQPPPPRDRVHMIDIDADDHPQPPTVFDDPFQSPSVVPPVTNASRSILDVFLVHDDVTGKVSIDWTERITSKDAPRLAHPALADLEAPLVKQNADTVFQKKTNTPAEPAAISPTARDPSDVIILDGDDASTLEEKAIAKSTKRGSRLSKSHTLSTISKMRHKDELKTRRRSAAILEMSQGDVPSSRPSSTPALDDALQLPHFTPDRAIEDRAETGRSGRKIATRGPVRQHSHDSTPGDTPLQRRRVSFSHPREEIHVREPKSAPTARHSTGSSSRRRSSNRARGSSSKRIIESSDSDDNYRREPDVDFELGDNEDDDAFDYRHTAQDRLTDPATARNVISLNRGYDTGYSPLTGNVVIRNERSLPSIAPRPRLPVVPRPNEAVMGSSAPGLMEVPARLEAPRASPLDRKKNRSQVHSLEADAGSSTRPSSEKIEPNLCPHDPQMVERLKTLIAAKTVGLYDGVDADTNTANRGDEVDMLEKIVSGPESNSSPDISDLEREHGEGYIPDLSLFRGIFRQCIEKGFTLDELDQFDYAEEVSRYYKATRRGPEYTPNVASFGEHFLAESVSPSEQWKWVPENETSGNSGEVLEARKDNVASSRGRHQVQPEVLKREASVEVVLIESDDDDYGSSSKSRGLPVRGNVNRQHPKATRASSRKAALQAKRAIAHEASDDDDEISYGSYSDGSASVESDPPLQEDLILPARGSRRGVQNERREQGSGSRSSEKARELYERVCGDMIHTMSRMDRQNVLSWADHDFSWFRGDYVEIKMESKIINCTRCLQAVPGVCEENIFLKLETGMSWRKIRRYRHRAKKPKAHVRD